MSTLPSAINVKINQLGKTHPSLADSLHKAVENLIAQRSQPTVEHRQKQLLDQCMIDLTQLLRRLVNEQCNNIIQWNDDEHKKQRKLMNVAHTRLSELQRKHTDTEATKVRAYVASEVTKLDGLIASAKADNTNHICARVDVVTAALDLVKKALGETQGDVDIALGGFYQYDVQMKALEAEVKSVKSVYPDFFGDEFHTHRQWTYNALCTQDDHIEKLVEHIGLLRTENAYMKTQVVNMQSVIDQLYVFNGAVHNQVNILSSHLGLLPMNAYNDIVNTPRVVAELQAVMSHVPTAKPAEWLENGADVVAKVQKRMRDEA